MSRRIILDGYNIINHWSHLKTLKEKSLSLARDELIRLVCDYHAYSGDEITIVFDGAKTQGISKMEEVLGIRIIFSNPPSTADGVIERMVYKDERRSSIIVATADSSIRNFVLAAGANWISPQNLEREIRLSIEKMRKDT